MTLTSLDEGLCPDLENWYFAPVNPNNLWTNFKETQGHKIPSKYKGQYFNMLEQTYKTLLGEELNDNTSDDSGEFTNIKQTNTRSLDGTSIDETNTDDTSVCLTVHTDYLISCIEMALAEEYRVINFDFYNDWINGAIYMPRWNRKITPKRTFLFGLVKIKSKVKACMDDSSIFGKTRRYTQQCALSYKKDDGVYTKITTEVGCNDKKPTKQKCHKNQGKKTLNIFGSNGGVVHENETSRGQKVYYFKPCEWNSESKRTILFANDLILLGSLKECNQYGIPQAFKYLTSSSYILPTNLALTNMDDEGYLFAASDSGTYCGGKENDKDVSGQNFEAKIETMDLSYEATQKYWSTYDDPIVYGNGDGSQNVGKSYDDTIPVTEAAGISWNYTGPGQGKASKSKDIQKRLYQPGGHFLGLSCFNSETNIKSCINLQRICEAGTTMSQRREVVRTVDVDGDGNAEVKYQYYVPTGLISYDDIDGGDFRTMFSSMNHHRLLCTGDTINENTGYPIYDFMYLKTNGFNGALAANVSGVSEYNEIVDADVVNDEYDAMTNGSGVTRSNDYDDDEKYTTSRKTIETTNKDYYKFRLGLDDLSDDGQKKRFLKTSYSDVSLPQYENSFYFYFGLKDGATALDEFSKQFFSTCESRSIVMNDPYISANVTTSECDFLSEVDLIGNFLVAPIVLRIEDNNTGKLISPEITMNTERYKFENDNRLPFGTYKITMTDANDTVVTKILKIGDGAVSTNITKQDFQFRIKGTTPSAIYNEAKGNNMGGYIDIYKDFTVNGVSYSIGDGETGVYVSANGNYAKYPNELPNVPEYGTQQNFGFDGTLGDFYRIYGWGADIEYTIYVAHKCNGKWYSAEAKTLMLNGIDDFELYVGSKLLPCSEINDCKFIDDNYCKNDTLKGWAARHSLFRQSDDDTSVFTNNLFAMKGNRYTNTVVFGQPELPDGSLVDGIFCEYDNFAYEGDVSDNSIKYTWGYNAEREHFYKIGINGTITTSEGTMSNVTLIVDNGDGSKTFTVNSGLSGDCFVGKVGDAMFYFTKDGAGYKYYGDVLSVGDDVAIYPAFQFPVMYRPFYTAMNYFIWDIARVDIEQNGSNVEYAVNSGQGWRVEPKIYNGITYNNRFSSIVANNDDITDSWERNSAKDIDIDNKFGVINKDSNRIYVEDYVGVSGKSWYEHTEIDDTLNGRVTYSITEGCPDDNGSDDYKKLNTPNAISLTTIAGSLDYDFNDSLECAPSSVDGSYIFVGESASDTQYYLLDKSYTLPFSTEPKFVYYAEGGSGAVANPTMSNVDVLYVYARYNEFGIKNGNSPDDTFFIKIEKKGNNAVATYSIYPENDSDEEKPDTPTEYTAIGKWVSNTTIDNYLNNSTFEIDGGNIGKKNTSFNEYFAECGIELITTYQYEYGKDDLLSDSYIEKINNSEYKEISFDGSSIDFDPENVFGLGVKTGMTTTRSLIRIFKFYPKINVLNGWSSGGEKPFLKFEPIDTVKDMNMFNSSGGSMTWKIKSNVDWKWNFEYEQSSFKDWLSFMTGDIEEVIKTGTSGSGVGGKQYIVKAKDNTGTDGHDGNATGLVEKNGKKYYTLYVSGVSDTVIYDEETNTPTPLSAYTRFYLEAKQNKSFMNINNSVSDTYTFGNGGGTVDIKVTNNIGAWDVKWDGTAPDWISIDANSTGTKNGDGFVRLIVDKNEEGKKKTEASLSITPYCGSTANYEYKTLKFNMNAAPVNTGGDVSCDNPITFDYTGGVITTAITANLPWSAAYPTWLYVSPRTGNGNANITLSAGTTTSGHNNENVTINLEGGAGTITICVKQNGDTRKTPKIEVIAEYPA